MVAAWNIYAQQLIPLGYGHPLWGPEPCPRFGEVHLGDVGYLREGHFCFLFNAIRDADDPINRSGGVPQDFEKFQPPERTLISRPNLITQPHLHSKNLQSISISTTASASGSVVASASAGLRYQCNENSGALLILKRPAHKTYFDCNMLIRRYMRQHLASWCEFANTYLGIGLDEKDIIFVSGFTKTSMWAEAAFSNSSSSGELIISGGCFVPSASGEFRVSMTRCNDASVFSRTGPVERVTADAEPEHPGIDTYDQCIFLNYYKMKSRGMLRRPNVLRAAAGPHQLPDDFDSDDGPPSSAQSMGTCSDTDTDSYADYNPVNILLDYILKHSNAEVAYATDKDLMSIFKDQTLPEDLESELEALAPIVRLDDEGYGSVTSPQYAVQNIPRRSLQTAVSNDIDRTTIAAVSSQRLLNPISRTTAGAQDVNYNVATASQSRVIDLADISRRQEQMPSRQQQSVGMHPPAGIESYHYPSPPAERVTMNAFSKPHQYSSYSAVEQTLRQGREGSPPLSEYSFTSTKHPSTSTVYSSTSTYTPSSDFTELPFSVSSPAVGSRRRPVACVRCRRLKMRCEFPSDQDVCKRCKVTGCHCVVEGRKPRYKTNKRENILAQIRQKDTIIESLLKQIHNPYLATPLSIASYRMATSPTDQNSQNVLEWLDRLQSSVRAAGVNIGDVNLSNMGSRGIVKDVTELHDDAANFGSGELTVRGLIGHLEDDEPLQDAENKPTALPNEAVPLGLLADLALSTRKRRKNKKKAANPEAGLSSDDDVGVACETFFDPGPAYDLVLRANMVESLSPPEILVHGLVTPDDVDKLFEIYFERINVHCAVLDPVLHTPTTTFLRCPFLFTVVCAISSRYYEEKAGIYPIAMHFAKQAAASALLHGWRSVELSQAYILMSMYGVPTRRLEEDSYWLYTGLAIRVATNLNLHVVSNPETEMQEREMVNQNRTWLICFSLDRSTAIQFGKPPTIKEDYMVYHSTDWYKSSHTNSPLDIGTSAYVQMLRVVSQFQATVHSDPESPTGLNQRIDIQSVTLEHNQQLTQHFEEWSERFQHDSDLTDPILKFRADLLPFLNAYLRLVMFSVGFQQVFKRGLQAEDLMYLEHCFESAKAVIVIMIESLIPSSYMRTSPDGYFVFASFASAFLLKSLRPELSTYVSDGRRQEVFNLITRLIDKLGSPEVAIDERHTPALHSRFLHGLLREQLRGITPSSQIADQQQPHSEAQVYNEDSTNQGVSVPTSSQQLPFTFDLADRHRVKNTASYSDTSSPWFSELSNTTVESLSSNEGSLEFDPENPLPPEEDSSALWALQNPSYWKDMMMPGFTWPESAADMPPPHDERMNVDAPLTMERSAFGATKAQLSQHMPEAQSSRKRKVDQQMELEASVERKREEEERLKERISVLSG